MSEQKPMTLIIKKVFFDQIVSGEKTIEYRDLTQFYVDRFCNYNADKSKLVSFKPIKQIRLAVGYSPNRPFVDIEVKKIELWEYVNRVPEGFNHGDWSFEIHLGKIIHLHK